MINRIPDYLKLFIEDEEVATPGVQPPEFERLCSIFPEATGLELEIAEHDHRDQLMFPWSDAQSPSYRVSIKPTKRAKLHSLSVATELEDAMAALLNEVCQLRDQLRHREAELAMTVPVVSVDADGQHLADRLEAVLRGTADALQCHAAGLYVLDDATTALKLRAQFGMGQQAFLEPARKLEEAVADVEAMAGRAVVIEDARANAHWRIPESSSRSAICIPVSSATTILGTLWLHRDFKKDFTPTEQNLAEITAGRLASDLDRAVLSQEVRALRTNHRQVAEENDWTAGRLERLPPLVDGWDIAEAHSNASGIGDFCLWHLTEPDRLHFAIGAAHHPANSPFPSIAYQSVHAAHTSHDPSVAELFEWTNQSLWTSSIEGSSASLFHAVVDPTCGALQYGLVGGVFAYILRPHGWEPLLGSRAALGSDSECQVDLHRQMLMPGDILIAMSGPSLDGSLDFDSRMNRGAEKLLRNTHLTATELSEIATNHLRALAGADDNLAVLVAKRED